MTHWIQAAAASHPDRVAIEGPGRSLTYAELAEEATSFARALAGMDTHRPVGLALAPGEEFVVGLHGCLLAGLAAVPVDLRLSPEERERRLAGVELVVTEPLRESRPIVPLRSSRNPVVAIMHTSGTTSSPKRVPLTHGNFQASALGSAVALGLDVQERWLCPMPLTHVGGLSIPIRSAIYATTAILHARFDTQCVLEELMDPGRRITMVSLVPTMLARLLDAGLARPPTLRWVLLGGGPIPPGLLERAGGAGVPVAPTYGMTEACSQIATFGWPLLGVEVRLDGDEREIAVRGAIVSPSAVSDDGWLHTGDLGAFDDRGRLAITGRRADTIVTGGENVAPAEVEAVLLEHPSVADAAVVGRPDPEWGEALVALVVARDGEGTDPEELRAHCRTRLAGFKVPKSVELVQALPRTASGKLLRRQLG